MRTLKLAVCDDEVTLFPYLCSEIRQLLKAKGLACDISTYSDGRALIGAVSDRGQFDVIFLDIDMPEIDGIRVAEKFRLLGVEAHLVFVSAKEGMVFDTFAVRPLYFVRKSHFRQDLEGAVESLVDRLAKPPDVVVTLTDILGYTQRINITQTMYIEAMDKYIKLHTAMTGELLRCTMRQAEECLAGHHFIRVHKTYLVNARFIFRFDRGFVELDDKTQIPLSRYRAKEAKEQYMTYLDQ